MSSPNQPSGDQPPPTRSSAPITSTMGAPTTSSSAPTLTSTAGRRAQLVRRPSATGSGGSQPSPAVYAPPSTQSEIHLYLLLFHANLTAFYTAFIQNGGDDVQQLCDAQKDERELLEILNLVGMSKPLHVRRFQKSLVEYIRSPTEFVLTTMQSLQRQVQPPAPVMPQQLQHQQLQQQQQLGHLGLPFIMPQMHTQSQMPSLIARQQADLGQQQQKFMLPWAISNILDPSSIQSTSRQQPPPLSDVTKAVQWMMPPTTQPHTLHSSASMSNVDLLKRPRQSSSSSSQRSAQLSEEPHVIAQSHPIRTMQHPLKKRRFHESSDDTSPVVSLAMNVQPQVTTSNPSSSSPSHVHLPPNVLASDPSPSIKEDASPAPVTIALTDDDIARLVEARAIYPRESLQLNEIANVARCSANITLTLKQYDTKMVQNKKKITQEMLYILKLPPGEERMRQHRKHAAIYGRYDAKRNKEKELSFHENLVNESAAQICLWRPALLTRRDELFPLARQCVKDAGYNYVKTTKMANIHVIDDTSMHALMMALERDTRTFPQPTPPTVVVHGQHMHAGQQAIPSPTSTAPTLSPTRETLPMLKRETSPSQEKSPRRMSQSSSRKRDDDKSSKK